MAHSIQSSAIPAFGGTPDRERSLHPEALHEQLASLNRRRLNPSFDCVDWEDALTCELALRLLEGRFVETERAGVQARAAAAPADADAFVAWFRELEQHGPGQRDPLFPWLAKAATLEEMRWFLQQELAGEAGFDDLVALTQLKLPQREKLELARNYWDEMGQGRAAAMHGPLLEQLSRALSIEAPEHPVWESLALANLMTALAANRRYAYQSIGALGVVELTAPGRAVHVNAGLKRLGLKGEARRYFALHATLDRKHSADWCREILHPLVVANPLLSRPIAEGALLRLQAGARCFDRYRAQLTIQRM